MIFITKSCIIVVSIVSSPTTQSHLRQFFTRGTRVRFKKGEMIIRADERQPFIYWIQQGYVKVYFIGRGGDEIIQLIIRADEIFPGRWLIHYKEDDIYYEAMADLVVWRQRRADLREAFESNPKLLLEVTEYTYDIFRVFMDRLKNVQQKTARDRLITYLLLTAERFGQKQDNGVKIMCPLTHQTIASCINLSRETASREFEKLKREKLVAYDESTHLIILPDVDKLQAKLE